MAKPLRDFLLVSTEPRAGKTLLGCALGFAATSRGMRAGVMKPVETGCTERGGRVEPRDAVGLAFAARCGLPLDVIAPYRYLSGGTPIVAAAADRAEPPDLARIADLFRHISARTDIAFVEAPAELDATVSGTADVGDLAKLLGCDLLVVVRNRPGCVELTQRALRDAASRGLRAAGVVVNDAAAPVGPDALGVALQLSKLIDVPCLGAIRYREPVGKDTIDSILGPTRN
jgi:dethiobiotin synthetase